MGVVVRQSMKFMIATYAVMVFSVLANIFIYPLNEELYGTFRFYMSTAGLFLPLICFGMPQVILKFHPEFTVRKKSSFTLFYGMLLIVVSLTVFTAIMIYLFRDSLSYYLDEKSKSFDFTEQLWVFVPLMFVLALQACSFSLLSNLGRTAYPKLLEGMIRLTTPIAFFLVYFNMVTVLQGMMILVLNFVLSVILVYRLYFKIESYLPFNLQEVTSFLRRQDVISFALFGILSSFGAALAFRIDQVLITTILNTKSTGIYAIGSNIGSIINVPTAAVLGIVAPIVSAAMHRQDQVNVSHMYRRSSLILTAVGSLLLAGLFVIIYDLLGIMSNTDEMLQQGAIMVIFAIALAHFVNMITSTNAYIIAFSKFYQFNLYIHTFMAAANIALNFILIPRYGIPGAAIATLVSFVFSNLVKVGFVYFRLGYWPFSFSTLYVVLIAIIAALLTLLMTDFMQLSHVIGLLVKGSLVVLLFGGALYFSELVPDFNQLVRQSLNWAVRRMK